MREETPVESADNVSQGDELQEMTFWDHLDALRSVLVKMAAVLVCAAVLLFAFMPHIFDSIILAPCRGDFVLYRAFERITAALPHFMSTSSTFSWRRSSSSTCPRRSTWQLCSRFPC